MGNSIAVEVPDRDKGLQWYAHVTMPSCTLNFIKKDFPLILFFAIRHKGIYCLKIKWFSRGGIY